MKVLVCGAQVPFVTGGAELHMANLVQALTDEGHTADLVHLPVAWDKARMFDSALAWRLVPADADLVIATNFPSYYVRHPRKVVWLFHQHRGAYDAIDEPWSDLGHDDISLEAQRQLTEWDTRALAEAVRIYTTSHVVADRLARYNGLTGTPLYHPPPLAARLQSRRSKGYLLCPTRLEANKRPDRVVAALACSKSAIRLVLTGRGSLVDSLQRTAHELGVDQRLDMPGFVSDDDLVDLYADALAVAYAPHDEDYGYVTLQAFLAGKPVITSVDAGGVLEWVEDGITGLVTDGSPEELGAAYDLLAADPAGAAAMGARGRARVADLSWPRTVQSLLEAAQV